MAFLLPEVGELVLSGLESGEATNIVTGAETAMTQFKNEVIKGGIFGTAEGALFSAGQTLYNDITGNGNKNDNRKGRKPKRCH